MWASQYVCIIIIFCKIKEVESDVIGLATPSAWSGDVEMHIVSACDEKFGPPEEFGPGLRWPRRLTRHSPTACFLFVCLFVFFFVRMRICSTTGLVMAVESDERKALMEMSDALFEKSEQLKRLAQLSGPISSRDYQFNNSTTTSSSDSSLSKNDGGSTIQFFPLYKFCVCKRMCLS